MCAALPVRRHWKIQRATATGLCSTYTHTHTLDAAVEFNSSVSWRGAFGLAHSVTSVPSLRVCPSRPSLPLYASAPLALMPTAHTDWSSPTNTPSAAQQRLISELKSFFVWPYDSFSRCCLLPDSIRKRMAIRLLLPDKPETLLVLLKSQGRNFSAALKTFSSRAFSKGHSRK